MFTITIRYISSGTVRVYRDMTQREVNKIVSRISGFQDFVGEVDVKIDVRQQLAN